MSSGDWSSLFHAAFRDSRNAMVLADDDRRIVDVNGACLQLLGYGREAVVDRPMYEFVAGDPVMTPEEWVAALARHRFAGAAEMLRSDGATVDVQWGATTELVTGRQLVLVVALSVSGRGRGIRSAEPREAGRGTLSKREREIVRLVALGGGDRRRAPDQPPHGPHSPAQLDAQDGRPLTRSPGRQGARGRARAGAVDPSTVVWTGGVPIATLGWALVV